MNLLKNKFTVKVMRIFCKFILAEKMETINLVKLVTPKLEYYEELF